ncbi:MAG: LysR substrate-binding domain-containing protein [Cyanobacteria bacterium P01_C01_bin.69]
MHFFIGFRQIKWLILSGYPQSGAANSSEVRQYFKEALELAPERTIQVQAAATVADLSMVRQLVLNQQGYTVLPLYLCKVHLQQSQLALIHTPKHPPTNALYLAWNRGNLRHPRVAFAQQHFLTQLQPS